METAAQRYRRLKKEKEASQELHDVTCECGMTWKCRKTGIDFWVTSGILPMHLVEKMAGAINKNGKPPDDLMKTMATKEVIQSIEFASKVVRHTAVEPRIADTPEGVNDIAPDEVMTCCYNRLLNWQMFGGEEAARLDNFRKE